MTILTDAVLTAAHGWALRHANFCDGDAVAQAIFPAATETASSGEYKYVLRGRKNMSSPGEKIFPAPAKKYFLPRRKNISCTGEKIFPAPEKKYFLHRRKNISCAGEKIFPGPEKKYFRPCEAFVGPLNLIVFPPA